MEGHAYFYLRSPDALEEWDPERRAQAVEAPTPAEIEDLGREEAERRAEDRRERLVSLKGRLRESGFPVREGYRDADELGQWVRDDLLALVERLYPAGEKHDASGQEALQQEAYARDRARVFVQRPELSAELTAFADGSAREALAVLGESGNGKSALLANWALARRREHPEDLVLFHFVGSSPLSADWASMLRGLSGKLATSVGEEPDDEHDSAALRREFARLLAAAAATRRVVLVIDALNQLDERDAAQELPWLPSTLPAGVRLIVSTLPGTAQEALDRRGWLEASLAVEGLEPPERRVLIDRYLGQFTKRLPGDLADRIAEAPAASNPLYLRGVLDELRVWGEHESLARRLDELLVAETPGELFALILERYEADYEDRRPRLVRDAMALIWAARSGLAEQELLDVLGAEGEPLPQAIWAPLRFAAGEMLVERGGLFGFSHEFVRAAVSDRYLPEPDDARRVHRSLARYLIGTGVGERSLAEGPWQLAESGDWDELADLLVDPAWFSALWDRDSFDGRALWTRVERESEHTAATAYASLALAPPADPNAASTALRVSALLIDLGHMGPADRVLTELLAFARAADDRGLEVRALGNRALVLKRQGDLSEAMELHRREAALAVELDDPQGYQAAIGGQAIVHHRLGQFDEALALHREQERICRGLNDQIGLGRSLGNQALIHYERREFDQALALHREEERVCREAADREGVARSLGNQSNVHADLGDVRRAALLLRDQEAICRELGDDSSLSVALANAAMLHAGSGQTADALRLEAEVEALCRRLGDRVGLHECLGRQAVSLAAEDSPRAIALLGERARILAGLDVPAEHAACLGALGALHRQQGELEDALSAHREQQRVATAAGDGRGEASAVAGMALVAKDAGDLDESMQMLRTYQRLAEEQGDAGAQALRLRTRHRSSANWEESRRRATRPWRLARERKGRDWWSSRISSRVTSSSTGDHSASRGWERRRVGSATDAAHSPPLSALHRRRLL